MRKANFEIIEVTDQFILIRDIGPWDRYPTITNVAEQVVSEMLPQLNGRRLDYIDSAGDRATILIEDGKFAGFEPR